MGEGIGNERQLMPFVDAANIACGYHAGDRQTMRSTLALCLEFNVLAGAHPSFNDRENFGRREMELPLSEIYQLVFDQLQELDLLMKELGGQLHHVKPHGALYNMSARDLNIARTIATAVKDHDPGLVVFGLRNSCSIQAAAESGLKVANEIFADRSYLANGSLTPRTSPHALIDDAGEMIDQLQRMRKLPDTDTVCIHGDGPHALEYARLIHQTLRK